MVASHVGESGDFGKFLSNHQMYINHAVPYMVASHVGESGEYGDFGELLSNRQMYVNQFHTWWPAMLANLVNTAILPNIYLMKCNTLL